MTRNRASGVTRDFGAEAPRRVRHRPRLFERHEAPVLDEPKSIIEACSAARPRRKRTALKHVAAEHEVAADNRPASEFPAVEVVEKVPKQAFKPGLDGWHRYRTAEGVGAMAKYKPYDLTQAKMIPLATGSFHL